MDKLLDFFREFNIQTILSMAAIVWLFTRNLENKIEKIHEDFIMMNTRLSRTEGTIYGKDVYKHIIKKDKEK